MSVIDYLKQIRLFKNMSMEELKSLSTIVSEKTIPENAAIFVENMPGESLYIIIDGVVRLTRMIEEGEEQTLTVLHDGDFIGEIALLDGGPRMTTARAMKPTRVLCIKNSDFQNLLDKDPKSCVKLLKAIVEVFASRIRHSDFIVKELLLCTGCQ
jgi:CRP-like cAMP-binding protein